MGTQVTHGIKVSARPAFQEHHSNSVNNQYVFSYRITIENNNDFTVQVVRRQWKISDSKGNVQDVEGEGIVGQKPILKPGDKYTYESYTNISTPLGCMRGAYLMVRQHDQKTFKVDIPEFQLEVPYILN